MVEGLGWGGGCERTTDLVEEYQDGMIDVACVLISTWLEGEHGPEQNFLCVSVYVCVWGGGDAL